MNRLKLSDSSTRRFSIFVLLILFGWILGRFFRIETQTIQTYLAGIPLVYSAVLFILLYVVLTFFLWFTKDIFMIASAVAYGPYVSTIFIWIAEILNSVILFTLARRLGHEFVKKKIKEKWRSLWERMNEVGFWDIFALRAIILVPFCRLGIPQES